MPENANSPQQPGRAGKGPRLVRIISPGARFGLVLVIARFSARVALGQQVVFLTSTGRELSTVTELVRHLACLAHVSERTAWRWYARFLQEGYDGLIDRPREDKGVSRAFNKRDDAIAFVLTSFLDGHTFSWIQRQLTQLWPRLYGTASRIPSFDTTRELVHTMLPAHVAKRQRNQVRP
jgi:leucine-zipper of insertion element IS481